MKSAQNLTTVISLLLIFSTCFFALNRTIPRAKISDDVPTDEFSVNRALDHLKIIAARPHYVSSAYHEKVEEYLVSELQKLGLEVEIQEEEVLGKKSFAGTRVRNILTRIEGREEGKALLLLSHYDSELHTSFGASDAGSGVVTILESIRAFLVQGKQPKNDIIVLISDAEELGLLGAQAFVDKHRWSEDVGLVLNFEARGSGGPGLMFVETNQGNERLIHAFDEARTSHPFSNSLFYSIYKLLPNDTDLTVFRQYANIQGYNFAFIDDHFDYHTSQDSYERLDRNTLQHQGSYLIPLLTYFSSADLTDLTSETDLIFFNFPGLGMVSYPFSWGLPMNIIGAVLLVLLVIWGVKKKKLDLKEIGLGFVPLLIVLPVIGLASFYGWRLVVALHPGYLDIGQGFTYNGHMYIVAFVSLAIWFTLWIYLKNLKKRSPTNLYIAPLFFWLLINFAIAWALPGAGFFLILFFTGIVVLALFMIYPEDSRPKVILSTLVCLPMLLLVVPMIELFPIALGLRLVLISSLISSLLLLLLIPVLSTFEGIGNLNKLFLITSILTFISASFSSGFNGEDKKPDSILYVRNDESSQGYWGSRDREPDTFTQQFLGTDPSKGRIPDSYLQESGISRFSLYTGAKSIDLTPTDVQILKDTLVSNRRHLQVKVRPKRRVNRIDFRLQEETRVYALEVQGQQAALRDGATFFKNAGDHRELFRYFFANPEDSLVFSYSVPEGDDPSLFLLEISYDFFENDEIQRIKPGLRPREEDLMEKSYSSLTDAIVNVTKITY